MGSRLAAVSKFSRIPGGRPILLLAGMLGAVGTSAGSFWIDRFDVKVPAAVPDPMTGPAPLLWEAPQSKNGLKDYAVVREGDETFLRGRYLPGTSGKVIFKQIEWDVGKYPNFSWKWRVHAWAEGSTVRDPKSEDSTASVYISARSGLRTYVIKYIWAQSDRIGDGYHKGDWNPTGRIIATVIRSGGKLGEWETEKRKLPEDFRKLYGKDLSKMKLRGIGVLTEGDARQSHPEADYDDFRALSD